MKRIVFIAPKFREGSELADRIRCMADKRNLEYDELYIGKKFNPAYQQVFGYLALTTDIMIVDCTIPDSPDDGGVYPALTAQVNPFNHIIVISETQLPLNITPYRKVAPEKDGQRLFADDIAEKLTELIDKSLIEDNYKRVEMPIEELNKSPQTMATATQEIIKASFDIRKRVRKGTKVLISYRNRHSKNVETFAKTITGADMESLQKRIAMGRLGEYDVKVLPPASLCGADEAHTPMRRWMLAGLLEDHIADVDEVWVYGTPDYTESWWTIAEMVMVSKLNRERGNQITVKVYNPTEGKFLAETPKELCPELNDGHYDRLVRLLSNTRPDTMGPECNENMAKLKESLPFLRICPKRMLENYQEQLRAYYELCIPVGGEPEVMRKRIDEEVKKMTDPESILEYVNDEVFQPDFWKRISYGTSQDKGCFDGAINIDKFLSEPSDEIKHLTIEDFERAASDANEINLGTESSPEMYSVTKAGYDRYLWLGTRLGKPTIKKGNAPGLERIPIFNIKRIDTKENNR